MELRERLTREQDERRRREWAHTEHNFDQDREQKGRGNLTNESYYFNCNQTGAFCYSYKKIGHRAPVCPEKKGLRVCGFGIPGQGFYSIKIPTDKINEKRKGALGLMTILADRATTAIIERERKNLFREVHNWNIQQMSGDNEFLITFPNEDMRFQLARFKSFEFDTAIIKAKVVETNLSARADGNLDVVWVKAFNFADFVQTVEVVMEVAYIVGDLEEVDLTTLKSLGPIRVKLACRDYRVLKGETHIFFNGESFRIKWVVDDIVKENPSISTPLYSTDMQRDGDGDNNGGAEGGSQGNYWSDYGKGKEADKTLEDVGPSNRTNLIHIRSKRWKWGKLLKLKV